MKKTLIIIVILFILTSILTISFTIQTSQNFQFDDDDNGDDNGDLAVIPNSASQNAEVSILWNKTYGGDYIDTAQSIVRSSLGGYIVSGWTNSSGAGDLDILILRLAEDGTHIWNRTFGGIAEDKGFEIIEYSTGGYVIAATITNTSTFQNNNDFSVIRIAENGNLIWQKNYSGPEQTDVSLKSDLGRSIVECSNGDLALAGVTGTAAGASDTWFFRIGANGVKKWGHTYDHWYNERCYTPHSLVLCNDNGFAIACYTYNVTLSNDVWLIRTDSFGIPLWNKTYGVISGYERPEALIECSDGGFGIMANTQSFGAGGTDGWFVRTDSLGNQFWNKTFGGSEEDSCTQAIEMSDGGFTLIGSTHSFDIGNGDAWVIRIEEDGDLIWNVTIGDPYGNAISSFVYLGNNTYVATGATHYIGTIFQDLWVVKFQIIIDDSVAPSNGTIPGYNSLVLIGIWITSIIGLIYIKDKRKK
jgi:hypothetical protein